MSGSQLTPISPAHLRRNLLTFFDGLTITTCRISGYIAPAWLQRRERLLLFPRLDGPRADGADLWRDKDGLKAWRCLGTRAGDSGNDRRPANWIGLDSGLGTEEEEGQGGERPMGTTAHGGKGSKGREANGDRPIGTASCR